MIFRDLAKYLSDVLSDRANRNETTAETTTNTVQPRSRKTDLAYEQSEGVAACLGAIRRGVPVVMISGRAGTGKTRFIRYLSGLEESERQILVAPTGVAALNVGGSTIHKQFHLPFGIVTEKEMRGQRLPHVLEKIDRLVIDEVSMLRADTLDMIDLCLRMKRRNSKPFGNVQLVLVGDFLQLPPVVTSQEADVLKSMGYLTPFAFSAKALRNLPLELITLTKVWRQSDAEFVKVLGQIREGRNITGSLTCLNDYCFRDPRSDSNPMILTPTRAAAAEYNNRGIEALRKSLAEQGNTNSEKSFKAQKTGSFENSEPRRHPAPEDLTLLPGMRVMSVKNGPSYVNGSLGTIVSAHSGVKPEEDRAEVMFDDGLKSIIVERATWETLKHEWNSETKSVEKTVTGTFRQIPLIPGYALTIHKSQGLTISDLRIDMGNRGAFETGQLYVATIASFLTKRTFIRSTVSCTGCKDE